MRYTLLFLLLLPLTLWAQEYPDATLTGAELRQWLKTEWYDTYFGQPAHTNIRFENPRYSDPYRNARWEMYNYIDNADGVLRCVYSGYEHSYNTSQETNPQPINTEHTVPQSFFGSDEPLRSDIHHLYPCFGSWNSTRSNFPFEEIPDEQTTKWMRLNLDQSTTPTTNIDEYSEFASGRFEPREDHKGNVARAVFYFYTIFEGDPSVLEPIGSVADPALLYQWHLQDPVDAAERARNQAIATYQGNRNFYVTHPELVQPAFLPDQDNCANAQTPAPPTGLTATETATSVALSWNDTNAGQTTHLLERRLGGDTRWFEVATVPPGTTTYDDTAVNPGAEYVYRVVAQACQLSSPPSAEVSIQFGEDPVSSEVASLDMLQIAPNPSQGVVRVVGASEPQLYLVHSTAGRTVAAGTLHTQEALRLDHLAPGVYLLTVRPASGSAARHFRLILQ